MPKRNDPTISDKKIGFGSPSFFAFSLVAVNTDVTVNIQKKIIQNQNIPIFRSIFIRSKLIPTILKKQQVPPKRDSPNLNQPKSKTQNPINHLPDD